MPVIETRFFDSEHYNIETREQFVDYIGNRIQSRFFGIRQPYMDLNPYNIEIIRSFIQVCICEVNTFLLNNGRTFYTDLLNFAITVENNSLHVQFPESHNLNNEVNMPNTTLQTTSTTSTPLTFTCYVTTPPRPTTTSTSTSGPSWEPYIEPYRSDTLDQPVMFECGDLFTSDVTTSITSRPSNNILNDHSIRSGNYDFFNPNPVYHASQELRIVQRSQAGIGVRAMLATQVLQQKWKCINLSNRDEWRDVPIVSEGV